MNKKSATEKQNIVQALDSVKFDTEKFSTWMKNNGFESAFPYLGMILFKCEHGNLVFLPRVLSGVPKVMTCVYTSFDVNDQRRAVKPRPDRWGDSYRMILIPVSDDCSPWPGAEVLVSGGRSISGTTLSPEETRQISTYIQEWAAKPVEEIVRLIIARIAEFGSDGVALDQHLDDDLFMDDRFSLMEEIADVFKITIETTEADEWETVRDVSTFVQQRMGQ